MALSAEVQKLVNEDKWTEAYAKASSDRTAMESSFLVHTEDLVSGKEGYARVGETNNDYTLVSDAEQATTWKTEKEAKEYIKVIKQKEKQDNKTTKSKSDIKTEIVKSSDVLTQVGSAGTEKGEVIDLFLEDRFTTKKNHWDISSIKKTLVKLIEELGFSYNNNPFLQFIDLYLKENGSIKEEVLNTVNDLYVEGAIDTKDLQGKSVDSVNNILFNPNLYKFNLEDAEFIVRAYEWLVTPSNLKSHMNNPEALKKYDVADRATIDITKAKEIRNKVIFKTPSSPKISDIKPVADIQEETRFFEVGGDDATKETKSTVNINRTVTEEERWEQFARANNLTPETMSAKEIRDFITHLAREFKLI